MTIAMDVTLGILVLLFASFIFALVRNNATLSVRLAFIADIDLYPTAFRNLPPHDEMVLHPKHYHRWTKAQWVKYVEAK